jgi:UDPglucose 6-dehydrogenase
MIGVAGLSHLGINTAAALAAKGFEVVGYDDRTDVVANLQRGEAGFFEPGLRELLVDHRANLAWTSDVQRLHACALVIFALDVATDDSGQSDTSLLEKLIDVVIQQAANPQSVYVLLSQVVPGFTRRLAERHRGAAPQWYYQVETLIFGNAVQRALKPERFIVGCADPRQPLSPALAQALQAFACPILPMRYESAELAKISINLFLTSTVSVTNTLAEISEAIGADWSEIAPAMKLDRRIGPFAYLQPGLGIAGGNLERDLATVSRLAQDFGTHAGVIDAWRSNSQYRRDWALRMLHAAVLSRVESSTLAVWGLAYKADTNSTKNSPALDLIDTLRPFAIHVHDPQVTLDRQAYPNARQASSALEACQGADALTIMTSWREYAAVKPAEIRQRLRGQVVVDPFGVLDSAACAAAGLTLIRLGAAMPGKEPL